MVRPVTILFVEDSDVVLKVVKKTLELEGWRVEVCEDGDAALRWLEGEGRYDLIIADDDLPGASGLELIRRARTLPHRRETPIIMFSSCPNREEAPGRVRTAVRLRRMGFRDRGCYSLAPARLRRLITSARSPSNTSLYCSA